MMKTTSSWARNDIEGVERVDIELQSHPIWKRWQNSLSYEARRLLRIWRAGAIRSPMRLAKGKPAPCPWCAHDRASTRHFFEECPRFEARRQTLAAEGQFPACLFSEAPRVTSKTGWVTHDIANSPTTRAVFQVAACELGMLICELCAKDAGHVVAPKLAPGAPAGSHMAGRQPRE